MVKTVSPNGRIRGLPQRREFESHTIPFSFIARLTVTIVKGDVNHESKSYY